jgi:hypothetical protein
MNIFKFTKKNFFHFFKKSTASKEMILHPSKSKNINNKKISEKNYIELDHDLSFLSLDKKGTPYV